MKHTILVLNMILMVVTSSEVCAELNCYDNFDEAAGCLSSTNDFGTIYYSVNNGKMTIYGPAQKDESGEYTSSAQIPNRAFCSDMSGWSGKTTIPDITEINIVGNITSIGESAFWASKIEHIDIPNTVTEIKSNAFCGNHNLDSITIPASVTSIQNNAFDGTNITVFIEGDSMTFGNGLATTAGQPTLYCKQGMDACEGKASSVEYYIKTDNGLYQTVSDNKYFATPSLLLQGIACTDKQNCEDILAAQNAGTSFKVGSKIYNSIEDFEKGNHVKYRIYTVEEANRVAGDRNTVTIRYK